MKRCAALVILSCALSASVARADDNPGDAKRLYAAGAALYMQGKCAEATPLLERSAKLSGSPNPGLLIARCLRSEGKRVEAARRFEEVEREATRLVRGGDAHYADTVSSAMKEGTALRAQLGTLHITSGGARAELDGRPLEREDETVLHEPGHAKVVFVDEWGRYEHTVEVVAGKETPVVYVDPRPAAPAPDTTRTALPPEPPPPRREERRLPAWVPYATGALGIAGLGTFVGFGTASELTYADLETRCARGCAQDEIDRGRTFQTVANISLVMGIAFAALTGVVLIVR